MTTIARRWMRTIEGLSGAEWEESDVADEVLQLFQEHGAAVYRFCCVTLGRRDEAEDVVQDTFLKLLQHLRHERDRSNLRAWLFTVAANGCRDRARFRFRWLPWSAESDVRVVDPDRTPEWRDALAVLRQLSARDRLLLSLRAQGLSYREIAGAARVNEASVGRLLARAVARWKALLEQSK